MSRQAKHIAERLHRSATILAALSPGKMTICKAMELCGLPESIREDKSQQKKVTRLRDKIREGNRVQMLPPVHPRHQQPLSVRPSSLKDKMAKTKSIRLTSRQGHILRKEKAELQKRLEL